MELKVCPVCNGSFKKPSSTTREMWKERIFCSTKCRAFSTRKAPTPLKLEMVEFNKTHTLQETGDKYGVTRERIRQIVKKVTGHGSSFIETKMQRREEARAEKARLRAIHDQEVRFICPECGGPATFGETSKKSIRCRKCQGFRTSHRSVFAINCDFCGVSYHPWLNWGSPSTQKERKVKKSHFCSQQCSFKSMAKRGLLGQNKIVLPEAELARFIRQGWTRTKMAKHYGRNWATVDNNIKRSPFLKGLFLLMNK